ncbi:MAG TPA: hypothetical protein VMW75_16690 [Thermoanaerobaculia bacterium]|nr:hypothetical protein [Thermoanaerobaculia bacterium]
MNRNLRWPKSALLIVLALVLMHSLVPRVSRAEDCGQLKLSLRPDEAALPLHAPVFAALEIHNEGASPASVDLGKNFKGNLRLAFDLPDRRTADGPPYSSPPDGAFVPGVVEVGGGATHIQQLVLNEWWDFASTGAYRVRLRIEQSPRFCTREPLSAAAVVEMTARDEPRLTVICNRLAADAKSLSATSKVAAEGLSYAGDDACLAALIEVLKGDGRSRSWALKGLARIGSKDAAAAVAREWRRFDDFDRGEAMREFIAKGKGDVLLAAVARLEPEQSKPLEGTLRQ